MSSLLEIYNHAHEQVIFCQNKDVGLRAIIAIDNTRLGPALAGVRMYPYTSYEDALKDALALSSSMTLKNAFAGLNIGGGKIVIIGDPSCEKNEFIFRALGKYVNTLGGRCIATAGAGTSVVDMEHIYIETPFVTGVHQVHGGSGDPAPFTAHGAIHAILATLSRRYGHEEINQSTIAVQGLGHTGMEFVKLLHERGARLIVTDLDPQRIVFACTHYGAKGCAPDEIYDAHCDIFAPCGCESSIHQEHAKRISAQIICGVANNQLVDVEKTSVILADRHILYAPDYIVNAGGAMNVSLEIDGYNRERAMRLIRTIYYNLHTVFGLSEQRKQPPQMIADEIARNRITAIAKLRMSQGTTSIFKSRQMRIR